MKLLRSSGRIKTKRLIAKIQPVETSDTDIFEITTSFSIFLRTFSQFPLIKVVIPLFIGILIGFQNQIDIGNQFLQPICWLVVLGLGIFSIMLQVKSAFLISLNILILGWYQVNIRGINSNETNDVQIPKSAFVVAEQEGYAKKTNKGWNVVFYINGYVDNNKLIPVSEKWMVSVKSENKIATVLEPGMKYLLHLDQKEQTGTRFPGAFDWYAHLRKAGVQKAGETTNERIYPISEPIVFWKWALAIRNHLATILNTHIKDHNHLGIAGALLLGNEEWLTDDLEHSFAHAGVLHVLCVSGMHVVMVYGLLMKITSPFTKRESKGRHLIFPALILTVWMYAFLSGFGSSVIRAAAMATFVLMATWIDRRVHVKNLVFASLILVTLLDPYILKEVGFQLSLLAVCGIIFISPILEQLLRPSNRFWKLTWELVCVTISAQVATFPLSLYLFGQFPNWFLPANMIIVPLSTIAMYLGIFMMTMNMFPIAFKIILVFFEYSIQALLYVVEFFGDLPLAVTSGIHFTGLMCASCYLFILLLTSNNSNNGFVNWLLKLAAVNLILATVIYRNHGVECIKSVYLTSIDHEFTIATVSSGNTKLFQLTTTIPVKSKQIASQIKTRTGTEVLMDNLSRQSHLNYFPSLKLMHIQKWSRGARMDVEGTTFALETKTLLIGDSISETVDGILSHFPNATAIIVSKNHYHRRLEQRTFDNRRNIKLINLSKIGHVILKSD